jgi:RNA polymerase sigma-54 factor
MKQVLQFRMSQHLALTPQLQQSIRLLQLSTIELNHEIEQILAENPMLERTDNPLESSLRVATDGSVATERFDMDAGAAPGEGVPPGEGGGTSNEGEAGAPEADVGNDGAAPGEGLDWGSDSGRRNNMDDGDDHDGRQLVAAHTTLREHLLVQLSLTQLTQRDQVLVTALIEMVDEDGYLRHGLEEILEMMPAEFEVDPDELHTALSLLHSFDPPGVGARDASECLALQLRPQAGGAAADANPAIRALARALVVEHLALLAAHDFTRLKKLLHCDDAALRGAHALIRTLVPFPGREFAGDEAGYVAPDVIVKKVKNVWRALLNPDVMPKLRVNQLYAQALREQRGSGNGAGLTARLQEAKWLIKNVAQRFDTILRVSEAIVERQRNFFTHGEVAMRPLVLREIADTLGLHESTVSRVTTQKYMLTPFGTFELKYFFGSHVATEAGGAASSTATRALIKQLIGAEDHHKPLSDSKLAALLGEQGIVVARRTVAKYREALRIPPVSLRKSL